MLPHWLTALYCRVTARRFLVARAPTFFDFLACCELFFASGRQFWSVEPIIDCQIP
jgi:hypothetical protein